MKNEEQIVQLELIKTLLNTILIQLECDLQGTPEEAVKHIRKSILSIKETWDL